MKTRRRVLVMVFMSALTPLLPSPAGKPCTPLLSCAANSILGLGLLGLAVARGSDPAPSHPNIVGGHPRRRRERPPRISPISHAEKEPRRGG